MFVLTLGKNSLRRLGAVAVAGVALAGVVFAAGSFFRDGEAAPTAAEPEIPVFDPAAVKIENTQGLDAFFRGYGLEMDLADAVVDKVKVPRKWDESFSAFNTVVKQSGLDLERYKGRTVEKWMVLSPGRSTGDQKVYGVVLVYKQKPVGAYLVHRPSGEVTGLEPVKAAAAPLTEEEAAAASAAFGSGTEPAEDAAALAQLEADLAAAGAEPMD